MTSRLLLAILAALLVFGGPIGPTQDAFAEVNCSDLIDNDSDSLIDCADPSCDGMACDDGSACTITESCSGGLCLPDATTCGDGVVDAACGEQCEPVPGEEVCDSPDDLDGDGLVGCLDVADCCGTLDAPDGVSCSSTCQLAELCRPIIDDPAKIKFREGKLDFSKIHGRILVTPDYNASLSDMTYLVSNSLGEVMRHELPAGSLYQKKATRWSYKNREARDNGGIASLNSRLRKFGSETYYTFKMKTYGDYTGATEATMTTQLFGVQGVGYLRADWTERKKGWTLKNRDLRRAELLCEATDCNNGAMDGEETDVDCGGTVCPPCPLGGSCLLDTDCIVGECITTPPPWVSTVPPWTCSFAGCTDGTQNQDETDVDCGGTLCPGCPDGNNCNGDSDCANGFCLTVAPPFVCLTPTCSDGYLNQDETDVDCGGTICSPCPDGGGCVVGSDCVSGVCSGGICQAATCSDTVQNQDETDVDCGGATCPACPDGSGCVVGSDCTSGVCSGGICQAPTCSDAVQNQDETDVDCGGATCPACPDGGGCLVGSDCTSGVCSGGICQAPTCSDAVQNQDETDVDCGGAICVGCPPGGGCTMGSDCTSGVCLTAVPPFVCAAPTCSDGVQNQDETDVDCGGATCSGCPAGGGCTTGSDCISGICTGGVCQPSCTDGQQNQDETDIDCGGSICPACVPGEMCLVNSDCDSGFCVNGICRPPGTCSDGVLNQNESDIDCGGVCGATCLINQGCFGGGDCQSTVCTNNLCKCSSGAFIFNFSIGSNGGGATDPAEWPGGTQAMNTPATTQCSTTIDNPSGNIDLVGNLGDDFAVLGFSGFSNCFGNGGEDGDGCNDNGCPFAGIGSCESNRPSCSVALNGSGGATFRVQCNP